MSESNGASKPIPVPDDAGNIDRVRDILFGRQIRETETRVGRSEERILREIADLRSDLYRRVDTLEQYVKEELGALGKKLARESAERTEADAEAQTAAKALGRQLERRLTDLKDEADDVHRELRRSVLERSNALRDEIRSRAEELFAIVESQTSDLRHSKTDRATLAALFNEVAARLGGDEHGA